MPRRYHVPSSKALMGVPIFLFKPQFPNLCSPRFMFCSNCTVLYMYSWSLGWLSINRRKCKPSTLAGDVHTWRLHGLKQGLKTEIISERGSEVAARGPRISIN